MVAHAGAQRLGQQPRSDTGSLSLLHPFPFLPSIPSSNLRTLVNRVGLNAGETYVVGTDPGPFRMTSDRLRFPDARQCAEIEPGPPGPLRDTNSNPNTNVYTNTNTDTNTNTPSDRSLSAILGRAVPPPVLIEHCLGFRQ